MVEGDSRFAGKTNNGAVEQEGMPWLQRRLQTAYGIVPFVGNSQESSSRGKRPKGRRRKKKKDPDTITISSGVERLIPKTRR